MQPSFKNDISRHIKTSGMLTAKTPVRILDGFIRVHVITRDEAEKLAEYARKRNVFARHSWEKNFYVERLKKLADQTVIEILLPGDPKSILEEAQTLASLTEKIILLSTTFVIHRTKYQKQLALLSNYHPFFDVTIGSKFRYLRTKSNSERKTRGILIDERFRKRFSACKFEELIKAIRQKTEIALKINSSVNWLFESRNELVLPAAIIKSSTALEALFLFNQTESIQRTLSERLAFILGKDLATRKKISRAVVDFYEIRSAVLHGGRKKAQNIPIKLVEGIDRLVLMACIALAINIERWQTVESLREWLEEERFGTPDTAIIRNLPDKFLNNALSLCTQRI